MKYKNQKSSMKPAIVDEILLWTVLIVGFATLLFITTDYASILRLKSNNDALAQQGARMKALGRTDDEIATSLNNIRNVYYAQIAEDDISCVEVVDTSYQVVFNVNSAYTNTKILTFDDLIYAKAAAFNETNSNEITCTLTLNNN